MNAPQHAADAGLFLPLPLLDPPMRESVEAMLKSQPKASRKKTVLSKSGEVYRI